MYLYSCVLYSGTTELLFSEYRTTALLLFRWALLAVTCAWGGCESHLVVGVLTAFSLLLPSLFCESTLWPRGQTDDELSFLREQSSNLEQRKPGWRWLLGRRIQWADWSFPIGASGRTFSLRKWWHSMDARDSGAQQGKKAELKDSSRK